MRAPCRHCSVKEVQDTVVNALKADPEFVDSVAQKVGLRPPQFVAHFTQPLQSQETLVLDLCGQSAEPRQERARPVLLLRYRAGQRSGAEMGLPQQMIQSDTRAGCRPR